jgi:predicted HicB family RNase H-like nuclease
MGKGKVLVRMPPALHDELVRRAREQGVSLNQLAVVLLAGGVGFKLPTEDVDNEREP